MKVFGVIQGLRGLSPNIFLLLNAQGHVGNSGVIIAVTKSSLAFRDCRVFRLLNGCL